MIFFWGTKRVEKKVGAVADFCPICRCIQPFSLIRVGMASHVYYISFGQGKLVGHLIECNKCGVHLGVDPTKYASTDTERPIDLQSLILKTYPEIHHHYADRLAVEEQLKKTPAAVTAEDRRYFLVEPFKL